jgi:hypothetical protein
MKCSRSLAAVAALALAVLSSAPVRAQQIAPSVHFGATGGVSLPLSDFSTGHELGYYISGLVETTPSGSPVTLRGEVGYGGYSTKRAANFIGSSDNIVSFTGDVVYPLANPRAGAYAIGGVGLYHLSQAGGLVTQNDFGLNIGAGYKWQLADMSSFVEARVHLVSSTNGSTQFIPITFGFVF